MPLSCKRCVMVLKASCERREIEAKTIIPAAKTVTAWGQNAEIDAMIDEARATSDVTKQNEIYKTLQRNLVEHQVGVFLLTQQSQQAFHECLQGFTWVPMQSFEFNFHTMKWVCG